MNTNQKGKTKENTEEEERAIEQSVAVLTEIWNSKEVNSYIYRIVFFRTINFVSARYGSARFTGPARHDKKQHDEYYYSRDSQESLWDDEYSNEREDSYLHYATAKRNWKRPSSASEMERKAAERSRQPYMGTGNFLHSILQIFYLVIIYFKGENRNYLLSRQYFKKTLRRKRIKFK